MAQEASEYDGAHYTLSIHHDVLLLSPLDKSVKPTSVDLASIAFIREEQADGILQKKIVYLAPPTAGSSCPTVHSLIYKFHDEPAASSAPAFRALEARPPLDSVYLIVNPAAGARQAATFARNVVLPLLELAGVASSRIQVHETKGVDDGARIATQLLQDDSHERKTVMILGGDGTVHEVLNGLLMPEGELVKPQSELSLVLLPLGTANALYYHHFPPEAALTPSSAPLSSLYSLLTYIRGSSRDEGPLPLSVALNTLPPSTAQSNEQEQNVITSVVTSSALHACLLHDAEALRSSVPGVERFKIAAHQNASVWWRGSLKLNEASQRYDLETKGWRSVKEGAREIEGPFAYVVGSLVSRFEPTFVVAPLRSPLSSLKPDEQDGSIDLILIRPLRDSVTSALVEAGKEEKAKKEFVNRGIWQVMGGMYDQGKHLDIKYDGGGGVEIVEYLRCSGFSWEPTPSDDLKSNLVCLDGALKDLGQGGKLSTKALGADSTNLSVWA